MLPEECLLSNGSFSRGILWAVQPLARWPVHMEWLRWAQQLYSFSQNPPLTVYLSRFRSSCKLLPKSTPRACGHHRGSRLESLSRRDACHQLGQWIPRPHPLPCFLRRLGHFETPALLGSQGRNAQRRVPVPLSPQRELEFSLEWLLRGEGQPDCWACFWSD